MLQTFVLYTPKMDKLAKACFALLVFKYIKFFLQIKKFFLNVFRTASVLQTSLIPQNPSPDGSENPFYAPFRRIKRLQRTAGNSS